MKCPRCDDGALDERERSGVTVDVCTKCRGVWLDRGELEKVLAHAKRELEEERAYYDQAAPPRAAAPPRDYAPPPAREYAAPPPRDYDREPPSSDHRRSHAQGYGQADPRYRQPYRKRSWLENLGEIFD